MSNIPPPPEGFEPIDDPRQIPPPPPGFELIGEPVPGMEKLGGVPPGPARPPQAVGAPPPPANRGDFASGIIGGAHGAMSSLGGSVEMAGKLTGSDNLAALGGVIRADQAHKAEAYSKPIADLKNLKTGGDFADWAQYNLGNLLPSMGASTAGAIAGGMVAGPAGAAGGAFLVSYLLNAGEVYANLREQGVDSPKAAAIAGIPMAALDWFTPAKQAGKLIFQPVAQTIAKKGITGTLKNIGKRVLTEGLTEGGTEAGQEAIGAATEDLAGGKTEFFSSETLARLLNAAAAGALGGVTMGAIPQRGAKQDPAQPQAQAQAPQATPQGPQATAPPPAPPNAPVAPTAAAVPPGEEVTTEQDTPKPSIQRTVAALDFLGKAEGPVTKSALVDALEIGPREANDVLTTLLKQGDIQRTPKGYILTGRTFAPPSSPSEEAQPGQQIGILNQALQDPTDEEAPPAAGEAEPEPEPEPPSDPGQPRAPKVEPAYGHEVQIAVPGEETKYPARFAIREAADVYPSHNPMSFEPNPGYEHQNDRDYKDPQNGARVMEYSTPAMFAPDYLIVDNPTAEHGPSVVDPRGNVLGGNNRAMTLRRVYGLSPQAAEKYKSTLRSRMERYGIDPAELDRFQHPVLVRERTSAIDAQREITDYNKKASAALRPGEQAVTDGKRMSPRSIAAIVGRLEDAGESGTLADALRGENGAEVVQSLIADGVLTDQEAAGMLEQRGKEQHLTAEAKLRIGKALVGRLFPNAQAFNNTIPEIRNKLERIAPHVVRSEGQKAWGLTEDVRQALEVMERMKAHGAKKITVPTKGDALTKFAAPFLQRGWLHKDLSPLMNQKGELTAEGKEKLTRLAYRLQEESVLTGQGALEEGKPHQFSPRALAIARTLRLPDKAAAAAFRRYANDEALSRPGAQGLMFEPPSPEDAFREAFEAESPVESPVFSRGRKGAHQAKKGTFHLARVGGPRYQPGATLQEKAALANARVVTERGTPVVMVNGQGWDVLLHAAGMSEGGDANGVLMHPERVQRAIRRLRKGTPLRDALDRVDSTQFVPIINTAEHFSDGDVASALTEELDHLEQLNATGEIEHIPLRQFFALPEAEKAAAHLEREVGYEPEPAGMAIEIGVRLMRPGRYVELGLTPEEAVKLADHYVWLLRKRHGDAATKVIVGRVTKAFEDYVRGTEKALQFGHRRSRAESDGVDRGTEARGPPSDAGPVDEEERSRQLTLFARQREALARVEGVVAGRLPERASSAQIEGILRSPRNGLKPDDLRQSGVLDWIREQRGPIDKGQALSFFAKRRASVDANQQSLFGDLAPESTDQTEPKKQPKPAPKPPSGPSLQGGLFDAAEEEASQQSTRRDQEALQRDEAQAKINSPLPKPQRPAKPSTTGQGGLFDAQADLFSEQEAEPEPVSNDPASPVDNPPPEPPAPPAPAPGPAKMILTGDTYNHKLSIKRLPGGAEWNGQRKGWIVDDTAANRAAVARMSKRILMGEWGAPRPTTSPVVEKELGSNATPITPGIETTAPRPATVENEEAPTDDDAGSGRRGPERVPGERQPAIADDRGTLEGELPQAVQGPDESRSGEAVREGGGRPSDQDRGPASPEAGRSGSRRTGVGGVDKPALSSRTAGSADPVIHNPAPTTTSTPGSNTRFERDYRIPADRRVGGTPEKRFATNVAAIRALRALEAENRLPTKVEADILAGYVGWGAVPQVFAANKPEWAQRQAELRELLTPEEYEHARRSTTNAHYTSDGVVRAMWAAMQHLGAKPGMSWLEPAVGVGNFLGLQPAELLDGARRVALDKDTITGKIAQRLYPDSGVEVTAFEDAELPSEYFDAAVSNVPFGNFPVHDPSMKPQSLTGSIHNYFFAKSLHYVRPGGVVAFITSRYTMDGVDKPHQDFRNWIQSKADFLGAVRLPSSAFEDAAGTKVITDVIFLRRRLDGAAPAGDSNWLSTGTKYLRGRNQRGYETTNPVPVNSYYLNNPDNVLGEQALGRGMHSDNEYTVKGEATEQQVADALKRILPKDAFQAAPQRRRDDRKRAAEVKGAQDAKVGALFFDEKGDVYRRTTKGTVEPVALGVGEQDRLKRLLALRDTFAQLLDAERTGKPDGALRQKLNLEYGIFRTKYGPINKRQNREVLKGDPDEPLLLALETGWDGKTAKKAEIFEKAVLAKPEVIHMTDSAQDALMVSLNEGGGIDWDRMTALTGKTPEQLQKELQGVIFEVPKDGIWQTADEYLSGSVRKKLRQARAQAKVDPRFEANVKALEAVQPEDIQAGDIHARLGVTWVPANVYEDFIRAALGLQPEAGVKVQYAPAIGQWVVDAPDGAATSARFSTAKIGAGELIKLGLNMRKPVITMMVDQEEVTDPAATAAANQKLDELQEYFQKWLLMEDSQRAQAMSRAYNELHNDLRLREFDGTHLTLPGLKKGVKPFKHQLAAIWRVISQKNALLAHAVGAGKTLEAIIAGMELKRMGLVNRPMYLVPNATLSGWQEEFAKAYPGARVLVFTEKDLAKKNRQQIMARIATGSWDAVVVPHSSFQFLAVSDDLFNEHYEKLAAELEEALQEAQEGGMDTRLIKRMEKQKENLLANLKKKRADEKKDKVVTWEQLGIDHLFVDEAHEYKKLGFATKQSNIAGIDQNGNQKTFDLRMKISHVQRHGRGVTFMTGTPITNTMGEMFNVMKYLIEPELKARGIGAFDEWAAQFGRTVAVWEPKPEGGGYHAKNRFAKFVNLPELMTLFRSFADVVTGDQLDVERPAKKEFVITAQMTEEQEGYLETLQRRAEKIRRDPRRALPDNMLAVFGDAAKMALEQRMVIPEAPDNPTGRLSLAAEKIAARYKDSMRDKGTQLVFMDMGTPDGNAPFKTYGALIEKLVKLGVPREKIAYIHQAKNKIQRQALFDKVKAGDIRVLIGSTGKMGVGVNVQDRIVAMHHLDLPPRPADFEQRNGRGIRQGNRNKEVEIYTYLTAGTLDELKSAALSRKATFIHNALSGKLNVRESEDIGEMAATFQAFQAATSRDPRIQRKMEVDAEVARLTAIRSAWRDQRNRLQAELSQAPGIIKRYQTLIPELEAAKRKRDAVGRVWEVDGQRFEGDGIGNKVGEALTAVWAKNAIAFKATLKETPLGTAHGFAISLHKVPGDRYVVAVEGIGMIDLGHNPPDAGTVRSVENVLKGLEQKIEHAQEDQARFERRMQELQAEVAKPFPQEEKLKQYLQEQGELFAALDADQNDESAVGGGEVADASVEAEDANPDSEDATGDEDAEQENGDGSLQSKAKKLLGDTSGEARLDFAVELFRAGIRKFADWSQRMKAKFGQVAPQLFFEARKLWNDTRGSVGDLEQGPHGPVFREFHHDAPGAIAKLREMQTGEAVGALQHPQIGDIDLLWGNKKYGLHHILDKHKEMEAQIEQLGEIIASLPVAEIERDGDEIRLENSRYRAIVSTVWQPKGSQTRTAKKWLLTAFEVKLPSAADTLNAGDTLPGDGTTTPSKGNPASSITPQDAGDNSQSYPIGDEPEARACFQYKMGLSRFQYKMSLNRREAAMLDVDHPHGAGEADELGRDPSVYCSQRGAPI